MAGTFEAYIGITGLVGATLKVHAIGVDALVATIALTEAPLRKGLYTGPVPDSIPVGDYSGHLYNSADVYIGGGYAPDIRSDAALTFRFDEAAMLFTPLAEPTAVFSWPAPLRVIMKWVAAIARGRVTQSSTTQTLRNNANSADIATAPVSDAAGVFTRDKWS